MIWKMIWKMICEEYTPSDKEIINKSFNSVFISYGTNPVTFVSSLIKVDAKNKNVVLKRLNDIGCKSVKILDSDNLNSIKLKTISPDDVGELEYRWDDAFNKKYVPFDEVDVIDLTKMTFTEDSNTNSKSRMLVERLPNGGWHYRT